MLELLGRIGRLRREASRWLLLTVLRLLLWVGISWRVSLAVTGLLLLWIALCGRIATLLLRRIGRLLRRIALLWRITLLRIAARSRIALLWLLRVAAGATVRRLLLLRWIGRLAAATWIWQWLLILHNVLASLWWIRAVILQTKV